MFLSLGDIADAKKFILFFINYDQDYFPQLTIIQRDQRIISRYLSGETMSALARAFSISPQRVDQIVKPHNLIDTLRTNCGASQFDRHVAGKC